MGNPLTILMLTTENQLVSQRDNRLPGLRVLLDPDAIAHYWSAKLGSKHSLKVKIDYVRYKPRRRCIAMYQLRWGKTLHQIVATAHNADSWKKHVRTFDPSICETDPYSDDALSGVWISMGLFPYDRKLRRLQEMGSHDLAENFVRSFVDKRVERKWFSSRCVTYKPARRAVYDVSTTGDCRYALKFYDKASFEQAKLLSTCWDHVRPQLLSHSVEIPELIRTNSHRQFTATRWLRGFNLAAAMIGSRLPLSIFERVGSALGVLHSSGPLDLPLTIPPQRPLSDLASGIGFLVPGLHASARACAQEIESALDASDASTRPIHGDFYSKQICVGQDSIGILDFDQSCLGDPLRDVGNFVAKINWNSFRGDFEKEQVEAIEAAFLDGYQSVRGEQRRSDFELHIAAGLFRCVMHPFRSGSRNWTHQSAELLRSVQYRLERSQGYSHRRFSASTSPGESSKPSMVNVASRRSDANREPLLRSSIGWMADVLEPERVSSVLVRCCPELAAFGKRLVVERAELIRHKTGRRFLVRYDLSVAQSQSPDIARSVVGKTRFKGVDRHAFLVQSKLWQAGLNEANVRSVAVPKPLGFDSMTRTWFQEFVPGQTLEEMVVTSSNRLHCLAGQTAIALKTLHETSIDLARKHHALKSEVCSLVERLDEVATGNKAFTVPIRHVKQYAIKFGEMIIASPTCGIHRDFYPAQVLGADRRTHLVDFDLYCHGPADLDAGNYIGHLWELSCRLPGDASLWRSVATQFTNCYCQDLSAVRRQQLGYWAWLTLARHVWISTRISSRHQTTATLLDKVLQMASRATTSGLLNL